jgi:hypothetical protein
METKTLRPPIAKSDTRQINRLVKLRNSAHRQQQAKLQQQTEDPSPLPDTTPIPLATKILQLADPPNIEDTLSVCNKAITTIIRKAKKTSGYPIKEGERTIQEKRQTMPPKLKNIYMSTTLERETNPTYKTIRDPATNEIKTDPHTILTTLQSHFEQEQSSTTPDNIPTTPRQNPENPDTHTNNCTSPPLKQLFLYEILTRAH